MDAPVPGSIPIEVFPASHILTPIPTGSLSALVCLVSGPSGTQFRYEQSNYLIISALTSSTPCHPFPIAPTSYASSFKLEPIGVFTPDDRVFSHIEGDHMVVPREFWTVLGGSQLGYLVSHDPTAKMQPNEILTWLRLPESFDRPIELLVYTTGDSAVVPMSGKGGVKFMDTQLATSEEVNDIAAVAGRATRGNDNSWVGVYVSSKDQIRSIAALPFVYAIQIIEKPKVDSQSLSTVRSDQKETGASLRRPTQALTTSVKIAIDEGSGYDASYSDWLSPHTNVVWSWNMALTQNSVSEQVAPCFKAGCLSA